jgi:hypothetical protein
MDQSDGVASDVWGVVKMMSRIYKGLILRGLWRSNCHIRFLETYYCWRVREIRE